MHTQLPVRITFTGLDAQTPLAMLAELSKRYPIEWGILLHPARQGSSRFPPLEIVRAALDLGLVWTTPALQEESDVSAWRSGASHVSGLLSRRMTAGPDVIRGSGPNQKFGLGGP
jgi:hypothetical protein